MKTTLKRISGDIFRNELHDTLNLDGLILQVRYGFNPLDAAWSEYSKHPNPRIDANTMVYAYNTPSLREPSRAEFPALIHAQLDAMAARGVRRLALNPLFFRNEAGERQGGKEADRLMDESIRTWLATGDNASRFEAIYVVDKYAEDVPTYRQEAQRYFSEYIKKDFKKDLEDWFVLEKRSSWPFSPATVLVNSEEGIRDRGKNASLPFKATCLAMSVIAQSAGETAHSMDAFFAMTKVLGFPVIDLMMAGIVQPMRTMKACCLLPSDDEIDAYLSQVKVARKVIEDRIFSTLNKEYVRSQAERCLLYYNFQERGNLLCEVECYLSRVCHHLREDGKYPDNILSPDVLRSIR